MLAAARRWLAPALFAFLVAGCANAREEGVPTVAADRLPAEARATLLLIDNGGPYPYRRDGIVFQNRERRLPPHEHGYYREYTVPTPGRDDRGAQRIVTGGAPPIVFYYSGDHYRTFRRIER